MHWLDTVIATLRAKAEHLRRADGQTAEHHDTAADALAQIRDEGMTHEEVKDQIAARAEAQAAPDGSWAVPSGDISIVGGITSDDTNHAPPPTATPDPNDQTPPSAPPTQNEGTV